MKREQEELEKRAEGKQRNGSDVDEHIRGAGRLGRNHRKGKAGDGLPVALMSLSTEEGAGVVGQKGRGQGRLYQRRWGGGPSFGERAKMAGRPVTPDDMILSSGKVSPGTKRGMWEPGCMGVGSK